MKIYLKNFELDGITEEEIADATENYTASDLVSFLKEIHIQTAHKLMEKNNILKE